MVVLLAFGMGGIQYALLFQVTIKLDDLFVGE
jgi:hypothetical protein